MVLLGVSWLAFLVLEHVTQDVKNHYILKKSCLWVFIPFLVKALANVQDNVVYLTGYIVLIPLAFSAKKHSLLSWIYKIAVVVASVIYVLLATPLRKFIIKW